MTHTVELGDDGIIRAAIIGDMDQPRIDAYFQDLTDVLSRTTAEKPFYLLVDASQEGKMTAAARKAFTTLAEDKRLRKVAICRGNRFSRVAGNFIMTLTGRANLFGFFEDEAEALSWFNEDK